MIYPNLRQHLDDATSIFFERELEHIKNKTYEALYAPLNATKLIPVDSTTPEGADSFTYDQYEQFGKSKIISNYADDLPRVDVGGKQITHTIKTIATSFEVSIFEIQASKMAGKSLEGRRAQTCADVIRRDLNDLAFNGDAEHNIRGLLKNNPIVADRTINATAAWAGATPDQILGDLSRAYIRIVKETKGRIVPNTLVLPIEQHHHINTTPRSANSDETILGFFTSKHPGITVKVAEEIAGNFTGNTDGFIMYQRSPTMLWQEIPVLFRMQPPQYQNLAYSVPCYARFGGTIIVYSKSIVYCRGI